MHESDGDKPIHTMVIFRVFKFQRIVRVLAICRLVSILRFRRIWPRLQELQGAIEFSVLARSTLWLMMIAVMKFFLVILWLNHCLCCAWYLLSWVDSPDTGETWTSVFDDRNVTTQFEYTTALHFTLTQMTPGSMEVYPRNSLERAFTVGWLLFGLFFGSSLVSYLSAYLVQLQSQFKQNKQIQATLRRFLRQHGIHTMLACRVQQDIMERVCAPKPLREAELPFLSQLSVPLRTELWMAMFMPHISCHPLFHTWHFIDPLTTKDICFACSFVFITAKDELFVKGSHTSSAHILAHGQMMYTKDFSTDRFSDRPLISDGAWVSEAAWWMDWTTQGHLEAVTDCKIVCLGASSLKEVLALHPDTEDLILAYGKAFHKLAASMPADSLSDLSFLDYGEVVSTMPREARLTIADIVLNAQRKAGSRGSFAGALRLWPSDVMKLRDEVERGQCALVFGEHDRPVRVMSIVVLDLDCLPVRCKLAQLAKVTEFDTVPKCQMPATICLEQESPHDAVSRLLERELQIAMPKGYETSFGGYEKVVTHQKSDTYDCLQTRFTRNTFRVVIKAPDCQPDGRIFCCRSSADETFKLYSWLGREDYERFAASDDAEELAAWIARAPRECTWIC